MTLHQPHQLCSSSGGGSIAAAMVATAGGRFADAGTGAESETTRLSPNSP